MVRQTQTSRSGSDRLAMLKGLAFVVLLSLTGTSFADSADDERLRAQMEEARQELDKAAQRVAELSRQMASDEAALVVKRMSVGKRRAMLGVKIDDAEEGKGVRIQDVTSGGPAEQAGVRAGDLLLRINGVDLTTGSSSEAIDALLRTLRGLEPKDVASLDLQRDGQTLSVDVTTESVAEALPRIGSFTDSDGNVRNLGEILGNLAIELPNIAADIEIDGNVTKFEFDGGKIEALNQLPQRLEEAMSKLSGTAPVIAMLGGGTGLSPQFRFAEVTPRLGSYFGVERGVLVTAVPEEDALGLQEGDVLQSINGKPVNSRHDVRARFAEADEGQTLAVELVRERQSLTIDMTAPGSVWGRAWNCADENDDNIRSKRCESKDGRAYSFRFSIDDE